MTNKESIQAAHQEKLRYSFKHGALTEEQETDLHTTITAEAIGEAMIFTERLCRTGFRYNRKTNQWVCKTIVYTHDELKEKFLNQTPNTK